MEFKPYELAYYQGRVVECISFPTPSNTIMIRKTPGDPTSMIEIDLKNLKSIVDYLIDLADCVTSEGMGKLVESIGIDHDTTMALLFVNYCLNNKLNLSHCWVNIRFYIHDVLRKGNPEWDREQIYIDSIQQLCDSVALYARCIYDNRNDYPQFSRSQNRRHLLGSDTEDVDVHSDLREEGRDTKDNELSEGCDEAS